MRIKYIGDVRIENIKPLGDPLRKISCNRKISYG